METKNQLSKKTRDKKLTEKHIETFYNTADQLVQFGVITINDKDNTIGFTCDFKEKKIEWIKKNYSEHSPSIASFLADYPNANEQERLHLTDIYVGTYVLLEIMGKNNIKKEFDYCLKLIDIVSNLDFKKYLKQRSK